MSFTVTISDGLIKGALIGALTGAVLVSLVMDLILLNPIALFFHGWYGEGVFKSWIKGCVIMGSFGAVVGAILGLFSAPWWLVIPLVIAFYVAYLVIQNRIRRGDGW
ncbi:MAG: hypothetical protein PVI21_00125 [Candidatus Woesebacteria bacterium]